MAVDREQRNSSNWLCQRGKELLVSGDRLRALNMFEKSFEIEPTPECRSYLGMLTGTERGLVKKGIELCRASIEADPENPRWIQTVHGVGYRLELEANARDVEVTKGEQPSPENAPE